VWTRLATALLLAATGLGQALWRATRQLVHEITGALFALLAVMGAASAWRNWQDTAESWRIGLAMGFAVTMATFAILSFLRARRIR
jgi:cytochrome bd-type quinol oxidase subunit 1